MKRQGRVWVVGLSDVGRSPRLQNHAVSLATQAGFLVEVIGQDGSQALPALLDIDNIRIQYIPEGPQVFRRLPKIFSLPLKAILQAISLFTIMLFRLPKPDAVLLQVPPAIPTLFLCWLVCLLRGAQLVVDWHNFAYTLMALSVGKRHVLVRLAEAHERFWGRRAHAHLCVTRAMQTELATSWGIRATVFYDRPPVSFHQASLAEKHELLLQLANSLDAPMHPNDCCSTQTPKPASSSGALVNGLHAEGQPQAEEREELPDTLDSLWTGQPSPSKSRSPPAKAARSSKQRKQSAAAESSLETSRASPLASPQEPTEITICTERRGGKLCLREDRPVLLVSSTSWTPDEDFGILLEAAALYDAQSVKAKAGELPRLLVLVTGKGPQKREYLRQMRAMDMQNVAFRTLWLEPADYPRLLGACDAGVSLHTSSSGLDLPMKVVDMFGCGLPVFTAAYPCISELVQHGVNGLHFETAGQLAEQLQTALKGFPNKQAQLQRFRHSLLERRREADADWGANWDAVVKPVFIL